MAKVLLVEDDRDLCAKIIEWLKLNHHTVEVVHDGDEAMDRLQFYQYEIIILDWQLPNLSGIEICRQFRARGGNVPIIMLTGKGQIDDKEAGFDAGADDYLTKPFHLKELSARIAALLRRPHSFTGPTLKAANVELDPATHEVTVGGAIVPLLPKEFAILEFLMRHPNQTFSPDALLDRIWRSESDATILTVRTNIKTLRKKISGGREDSIIRTVHGVGYKLEA